MDKDTDQMPNKSDEEEMIRGLMQDLLIFGHSSADPEETINEPIDLMVDQALQGIDIRKRYPTFYQKLLKNQFLRQQFIDALASFTSPVGKSIDPYIGSTKFDFSFLNRSTNKITGWPIFLNQSRPQLKTVLFSIGLGYRDAVDPGSEPIYTLLRQDFSLAGTLYSVSVHSKLAYTNEDVLNTTLSLTTENNETRGIFPIQASLRWGEYTADVTIEREGKLSLPDIPLSRVLDDEMTDVKADLYLTLSSSAQ
jgi:hypothetical protein